LEIFEDLYKSGQLDDPVIGMNIVFVI